MEFIEVVGGVKLEPSLIKVEPEEKNTVEIGIDDIVSSSDEENNQDPAKKEVSKTDTNDNVYKSSNLNNIKIDFSPKKSNENQKGSTDKDYNSRREDLKAPDNLQTDERLVLNFSKNADSTHVVRIRKTVNPGEINWSQIYKTDESTDCSKDYKKIKMITPDNIADVEPHEFTRLTKDKFVCNHCQQAFGRIKHLKKHIKYSHREVTTMYQCPYCPFKSKYDLRSHFILKHKEDKDIHWFGCHLCGSKFKMKHQVAKHIIMVHFSMAQLGDRLKQCELCDKKFKSSHKLKVHVRFVHNKERKRRHHCQECEYTTLVPALLKNHVEVHHPHESKTYECDKCDFKTKVELKYQRHLLKHNNPFICEICSFPTTRMQAMKLHKMSHQTQFKDNDLKYRCDRCDYKTYRSYSLKIHQLNHLKPHEIEYFYCLHCAFKAKRKDNLKTHVLRHFKKEEVPFQCYVCDFSVKKRDVIMEHIKKHSKRGTQCNDL